MSPSSDVFFETVTLVGGGLIGSSIARALQKHNLCNALIIADKDDDVCARIDKLSIASQATTNITGAVKEADLVILCTPVRTFEPLAKMIGPALKPGAILSDVGSVKEHVIHSVTPHLSEYTHFIPGHPIAGTEYSGPESGFAHLFQDRWLIITPLDERKNDPDYQASKEKLIKMWEMFGSNVEEMDAHHHDKVLAITSHLPHLIAYTIVSTATDLEDDLQKEVVKFSASGFRDFTRIAASDPVMWRDVFLTNKRAVLEVIQQFNEDLVALQKAIRRGKGDFLEENFARTRAIRKAVIEEHQEVPEEYKKPR